MKKINFYTIFPRTENIHLTKDVGMVPFILHKKFGYKSTLVGYQNSENYPYLENEVKGLNMDFMNKSGKGRNFDLLVYILKNFRKIDVLQMYHFEVDQLDVIGLYILLRKVFLMKSFTWIKCDGSSRFTDTDLNSINFKFFRKWVMKHINLYTVETSKDFEIIKNIKDYQNLHLELMPNGFYDEGQRTDLNNIRKEKIILTVGRLGTHQKNTEFLLEAFRFFALKNEDWKLVLIGSVEKEFENNYLKKFLAKNPNIKERIVFTGILHNMREIEYYYKISSIFVMTSVYESFALVVPEAMAYGCYLLLSSRMTINNDVLIGTDIGKEFSLDSPSILAKEFDQVSDKEFDIFKSKIQDFAYKNFYWPNVLKPIHNKISKVWRT